ncbi:trehalose-6-phosphate synthase [Paraburkholderia atlantica]
MDEINDQFGAIDWKPVMYFNESVDRNALPEIYRMSRVGVVTPVADGMNLVAKEYIATQNPENPGVLVLSTGTGSASQLSDSLLVPPNRLLNLGPV